MSQIYTEISCHRDTQRYHVTKNIFWTQESENETIDWSHYVLKP